jgi:hypothetical protein
VPGGAAAGWSLSERCSPTSAWSLEQAAAAMMGCRPPPLHGYVFRGLRLLDQCAHLSADSFRLCRQRTQQKCQFFTLPGEGQRGWVNYPFLLREPLTPQTTHST